MKIVAQVLDGTYGKPAVGVRACLTRASANRWNTIGEVETNGEGYIDDWDSWHLERGLYRLVFDSDSYFSGLGATTAYPEVSVTFRMQNGFSTFHMQVTLAPYSYSTYFGTTDSHEGNSL